MNFHLGMMCHILFSIFSVSPSSHEYKTVLSSVFVPLITKHHDHMTPGIPQFDKCDNAVQVSMKWYHMIIIQYIYDIDLITITYVPYAYCKFIFQYVYCNLLLLYNVYVNNKSYFF